MARDYENGGMPPEAAAKEISELLGRPVRFVRNIYAVDPGGKALEDYGKYGIASWTDPDGAVRVAMSSRAGGDCYKKMLYGAVNRVCATDGISALLKSYTDLRRVALLGGLNPDAMTATDLRAFAESCGHNDADSMGVARNILKVAFGDKALPFGLEKAVCNGVFKYRRNFIVDMVEKNDAATIRKFAAETLSPYGMHLHVHLGRPTGAMRNLGYPDIDYVVDTDVVRRIAGDTGVSVDRLIDDGLVESIKNPMCVIRNQKHGDFVTAVVCPVTTAQKNRSADGTALQGGRTSNSDGTFELPPLSSDVLNTGAKITNDFESPKNSEKKDAFLVIQYPKPEFVKANQTGSNRLTWYGILPAESLVKVLSFRDRVTGETNIVDVRRKEGSRFATDIADALRGMLGREASSDAMRYVARNLQEHKNHVNMEDSAAKLSRSLDEAGITAPQRDPAARKESPAVDEIAVVLKKRLFTPLDRAGFSKAAEKLLAAAGITDAGALRANLSDDKAEDRFRERYGPKALRTARAWLESLGLDAVQPSSRVKVSSLKDAVDTPAALAAFDFYRAMKEYPRTTEPGTVALPVGAEGRIFCGVDSYQLAARVAANPRWGGCNVFLDEESVKAFGVSPLPEAEAAYPLSMDGAPVWNLMDLSFGEDLKAVLKERYLGISPAVPSSMLNQLASYTPPDREAAVKISAHLDRSFMGMAGAETDKKLDTIETAVMHAASEVEKKYDPRGVLQSYNVPLRVLSTLAQKGEAEFCGFIRSTRRDAATPVEVGSVTSRRVDVRFKLEKGSVMIYTLDGALLGPARDVLASKADLSAPKKDSRKNSRGPALGKKEENTQHR